MFCENCGANVLEGSKFCGSCGAVTEPAPPAYAAAEPAPAWTAPPAPAYNSPAPPYTPPQQAPPPYQQPYAPQQAPVYSAQAGSEPLRVGQYIGMFLLMCVPILSIVLLFVWSFGSSANLNKKNYARALLIMTAIGLVLSFIFGAVLSRVITALISGMGGYY